MKKRLKQYDSDTMMAFMYLAHKENHTEYCDVLKDEFSNCNLNMLHQDDYGKLIPGATRAGKIENTAIRLTLKGIALANELESSENSRFFNKAAFAVSIIALCISVGVAVLEVVVDLYFP